MQLREPRGPRHPVQAGSWPSDKQNALNVRQRSGCPIHGLRLSGALGPEPGPLDSARLDVKEELYILEYVSQEGEKDVSHMGPKHLCPSHRGAECPQDIVNRTSSSVRRALPCYFRRWAILAMSLWRIDEGDFTLPSNLPG